MSRPFRNLQSLPSRVAVVTGASEGIGRAVALRLAAEGCRVAVLARREALLQTLAEEIRAQNGEAHAFRCDLTDAEAVRSTLARIEKKLGPIDILVNNAGTGTFGPLTELSPGALRDPFEVPVLCALTTSHAVASSMRERGTGAIVTILSPASYFPLPYMVPYTASRWALLGFTKALREELRPHGVHVGSVCPGRVDTGYLANNDADIDWFPRISKVFPISQPDDVAEQVVRSLRSGRREIVFPWLLRIFVSSYQLFPDTVLCLLKTVRLFQPARRQGIE